MKSFLLLTLIFTINTFIIADQHALVIGIRYDNLPGQEIPQCENDADGIYKLLIDKYGFSKKNIVFLKSKQATQKNIKKGFQKLQSNCKKGDQAVIYYSGHGMQIDDNEENNQVDAA